MCEFCKSNNSKALCEAELIQGCHSEIKQDMAIFCSIEGSSNLCIGFTIKNQSSVENDIKINYCPICGRDLRSGIDDKN